MAVKMIRIIQ